MRKFGFDPPPPTLLLGAVDMDLSSYVFHDIVEKCECKRASSHVLEEWLISPMGDMGNYADEGVAQPDRRIGNYFLMDAMTLTCRDQLEETTWC
jgi:hypothetical protein